MKSEFLRHKTRKVQIGGLAIGGDSPILIQSMTNTDTADVESTVKQILMLEEAGCEIVRVAIPNMEAANAIAKIKQQIHIPLVADIHFDYRLALCAMKNGIDKLRINPGNIGDISRVQEVVKMAKDKGIPIRIGVNAGSLEKDLRDKYEEIEAKALVESAKRHIDILEKENFYDIIVSMKASNVPLCTEAYILFAKEYDYPVHVGITESGTLYNGTIKSAVGLSAILSRGIGDTIRVSLTADPVEEIKCAKSILQSLGIRKFGVEIISCPTCGRTKVDLINLAQQVEKSTAHINKPIKIAVMGCAVNGPGEAREADIGIAGGNGTGLIFKKGEIIKKVKEEELLSALMEYINEIV